MVIAAYSVPALLNIEREDILPGSCACGVSARLKPTALITLNKIYFATETIVLLFTQGKIQGA